MPLVLSMSLPMVISMAVNSLYNIVDSFFVAKISEDAMTALSLVFPIQNLVNAVTIGFAIGINAVIAYFLGAKQEHKANEAATQGIVCNLLHGILLTVGCIAGMPLFLRMFTENQTVFDMGLRYARIVLLFSVVISMAVSFEKIFQSVGKMKVSMFSMMVGCVSNILLDPVLIFGLGPAPRLGIEGAAIATGLGQIFSLAVYLLIYMFRPMGVRIQLRGFAMNKGLLLRLYSIGIPAALNMALPSVLISALNGILAAYGQVYVLVLGVYYKLQTFLYLSANGIIQGIRPLVGYNYGAGEYRRVRRIYTTSLTLIAAIMAVGTVLCLLFPAKPDGTVYGQPRNACDWRGGASHHQLGLCRLCRFRHGLRHAGRTVAGHAVAGHFSVSVYPCHYSGGVCAQPCVWRARRVVCICHQRAADRCCGRADLPPRIAQNHENLDRKRR